MWDVITIIFVSHSGLDPPTSSIWQNIQGAQHMYNITTDLPLFTWCSTWKQLNHLRKKSFPHNMESGSTSDSGTTVTRIGGSGPAWAPLSVGPTKCGDWRLVPAMNGFQVRGGDSEEKSRWCWGHITARLQSSLCGGRADRSPLFWLSPAR